jgi:hypothetical protein
MKNNLLLWIILSILIIGMTACQASQPGSEEQSSPDLQADLENTEEAYPVTGEGLLQIETVPESAYPITTEDLQMLYKTWVRSAYYENGSAKEAEELSLTFNPNNTYTMTLSNVTISGEWSASLWAFESTLIIKPATEDLLTYQIQTLEETNLVLTSDQEGVQIEEHFLPLQ